MGYQVGNICYSDRVQAENAYFSLVSPVIQSNGRLLQLQYNGNPKHIDAGWTLNGRRVSASLPQCDPAKNIADGIEAGWLFLGVMASLYLFVLLKKLIR